VVKNYIKNSLRKEIKMCDNDKSLKDQKLQNNAIIIYIADNGAILLHDLGDHSQCSVYKFDSDDLEDLLDLHYSIDEILAPCETSSKWSEKVIHHSIRHGSKYECKDPKCEICQEEDDK
jgi:hypothetical protein